MGSLFDLVRRRTLTFPLHFPWLTIGPCAVVPVKGIRLESSKLHCQWSVSCWNYSNSSSSVGLVWPNPVGSGLDRENIKQTLPKSVKVRLWVVTL